MTSPLSLSPDQQIDLLRAAATWIRELIANATPGPWLCLYGGDRIVRDTGDDLHRDVPPEYVVDEPMSHAGNAEYIAAMHPGVGLALADWLDKIAWTVDVVSDLPGWSVDCLEQALILAQRIRGEQ